MALHFKCDKCQKDMVSQFLKVGEKASCKNCGAEVVIPNTAVDDTQHTTNIQAQDNDSNYTLTVLNVFAWLDLIAGFILGFYVMSNSYILAAISIAQGILSYAICNGFIILIENSQKQTELLKKIANK
jgi:DNA-directed RNA polymerase subunit M/transcription elongation factor TFIIS